MPMKASWMLVLVASAAVSGCAGDDPANPNLAAPKIVVAPRPDGNASVFIHSAFGERQYDWIQLRVDNATIANNTAVFSIEQIVGPGVDVDAAAGAGDAVYVFRARIDVHPVEERASVAFLTHEGEWLEAESFGLPFERLLEVKPTE